MENGGKSVKFRLILLNLIFLSVFTFFAVSKLYTIQTLLHPDASSQSCESALISSHDNSTDSLGNQPQTPIHESDRLSLDNAAEVDLKRRALLPTTFPTIPGLNLIPGLYPSSTSTPTGATPTGATTASAAAASGTTLSSAPTASPNVGQTSSTPTDPLASIVSVVGSVVTSQPTAGAGNPFGQLGSLLSEGLDGLGNAILGSLDTPSFFLGIGMGAGGATALNLSTPDHASDVANQVAAENGVSATGVNEIALNVGEGLAAEVIPLVISPDKPLNLTLIVPLVFPFAEGIAEGALVGLDLTSKVFAPSTANNLTAIAGNVALGLSEAFASNIDLTKLQNLTSSGFSLPPGLDLGEIAENAGEGLSLGTAIGLGVTTDPITFGEDSTTDSGNLTQIIPVVVKRFTTGISSTFLEVVDFNFLGDKLGSLTSAFSGKLDIPIIAEGFVRGAVDGVADGISVAGGVSNFIDGKMPADALDEPEPPGTTFNDSINGTAVAFGRGLANEAVLQIGLAISRKANSTTTTPLSRRSDLNVSLPTTQGPIINSTFLNFLIQQGVNNLQCKGVGGIVAVANGLQDSKVISFNDLELSNSTTSLLPSGPMTITMDGNEFNFGLQSVTGSIYINSLSMNTFTYLTVLHVFFSMLAFSVALSLFIISDSLQPLLTIINKPCPSWIQSMRKITIYFVFPLFTLLGTIFGFIGMGNSRQLRTPHGIVGFLVTLLAFMFVAMNFKNGGGIKVLLQSPMKTRRHNVLRASMVGILMLSAFVTFILGFSDLRIFTLCLVEAEISLPVAILLGSVVTILTIAATTTLSLRLWLEGVVNKDFTLEEEEAVVVKEEEKQP